MQLLSFRTLAALTISAGCGAVALIAACGGPNSTAPYDYGSGNDSAGSSGSGGSSGGGTSSGGDDGGSGSSSGGGGMDATLVTYDGPPPNVDGGQLSCATPSGLPIKFNPMYSGYDGVHTYQVPTFVVGVDPATVTWGASDPSAVAFQPYIQGIMITTKKAGDVTIVARIGSMCGSAPLHIAQYTTAEWDLGNSRYNNMNALAFNEDGGLPGDASFDGSFDGAGLDGAAYGDACMSLPPTFNNPFEIPPAGCTNCHGAVGNGQIFGMTLFSDVSHTPEQTGGFSEAELTGAFHDGTIPAGGYFDNSIICYPNWHQFHTWWDIDTAEKQKGMNAYLRSLTPQEQLGCFELFKVCDAGPG